MQIRLTVTLGPRGSGQGAGGAAGAPSVGSACDVLVTAPAGTPLSAVTGGLVSSAAAAVSGASGAGSGAGAGGHGQGGDSTADSTAAVYAGTERLDPHRQLLGEPPLLDGAVVSLHGPALPSAAPALAAYGSAKARLHVVSGPDAGGIHLLQGGKVRLGRSAEADVPLDDPDVSRLHCAVTVSDGGAVTVADLGSTNGTSLDGAPVGAQPVLFRPGSTLRVGESALRIETAAQDAPAEPGAGAGELPSQASGPRPLPASLPTEPDGHGQLRLAAAPGGGPSGPAGPGGPGGPEAGERERAQGRPQAGGADAFGVRGEVRGNARGDVRGEGAGAGGGAGSVDRSHGYAPGPFPDGGTTHGSGIAQHSRYTQQFTPPAETGHGPGDEASAGGPAPGGSGGPGAPAGRESERPRARGLGAWARRFAGSQQDEGATGPHTGPGGAGARTGAAPGSATPHASGPGVPGSRGPAPDGADASARTAAEDARRPDPATILLTALGPGPRLWEREPAHPEALTVRIGTAHRVHGRPGAPVTVDLREAGALGLAGPRPRLMGLARSLLAQLAALHGPSSLEMVLISADRTYDAEDRVRDWSWLGWLPHLRPVHGQDCRLLTAYDRDQAAARVAELTHRLEELRQHTGHPDGPAGAPHAAGAAPVPYPGPGPAPGPYTLLVVDGDPGSAALRDAVARLAAEGPAAGIHLLALAETPAATPSSPVSETVRAAYETSAAFRECGALALLSGAVATAVRVVRRDAPAPGGTGTGAVAAAPGASGTPGAANTPAAPGTSGTVCTLDAVSAAWAERFARAMAPLRESEGARARTGTARSVVTLPRSTRLLDELGLARATPAALLARWAEPGGKAADPARAGSGPIGPSGPSGASGASVPSGAASAAARPAEARAALVFGAGPRGPLEAELGLARGHALITGPPDSGKTELLRSLAASLSVGSPPDRLQLVLVDGDGATGDGLDTCLELPHARHHLAASDPGRMREFAQSLSGELKRRAELFGADGTFEGLTRLLARTGQRPSAQQQPRRAEPALGAGTDALGEARTDTRAESRTDTRAEARADARAESRAESRQAEAPVTLRLRTQPDPASGPAAGSASGSASEPAAGISTGGTQDAGTDAPDGAATSSATAATVQHLDAQAAALPRIVILVDDFDTLADPSLGNPGRPAAGSVMRALEGVAREGARLGMHIVAASGRPDRTAGTAVAQAAALRAELSRHGAADGSGAEGPVPGRGTLFEADGRVTAFQAGRITGRIPRTATQRPTVVPLDWTRAGDPPARRPVRELGNGPTDLALLASAVTRAAQSLGLDRQESGMPAANRSRSGQDEVLES
ncbi:FHA domain-containing protein [Streptomyces sp. HNM0575]|uniref:FtsK/SpoIIIE domain-containing protein n=1 Tax=Streptomyces sp. HNM0575 TaxID=2716338 RepID=UPI00145CC885|nr:FtsK/SpoIIIE domain-containing protein [Streptomyces sp. HNM0575]NLU76723.1 FHA domain-containing protein [Streptomyces sp. HNM0575]